MTQPEQPEQDTPARKAEVPTSSDGRSLGVCVYLSQSQLRALGIDPEQTNEVRYQVDSEGRLEIEPVQNPEESTKCG